MQMKLPGILSGIRWCEELTNLDNTKNSTKHPKHHLGTRIVLCSLVIFLGCIALIKIVDCLFKTPGNGMTAIAHISAGEVLSYLGGVLSAIATGVLSYLVYRKEKRSVIIEEENARPALFVTMFGGVEANVSTFLNEKKNTIISILSGNPPQFSYGIYLTEKGTKDSKSLCARQYNFRFKYSGEIRCKKIRINKIEFLSSDNPEKCTNFILQGEDSIFDAFECGNEYELTIYYAYQAKTTKDLPECPKGSLKLYLTLYSINGEAYTQTIHIKKYLMDAYEIGGTRYPRAEILRSVEYDI